MDGPRNKRYIEMWSAIVGATLLVAAPAWAGKPIDQTRPLQPDARLSVSNVSGTITVEAGDRDELRLTGELGEGTEGLDVTGDEKNLRIEVKVPHHSLNVEKTDLKLRVPPGVSLDVQSVSADVSVRDLRGPLNVNSVSGDVALDVQTKKVAVRTVSGDMQLRAPAATDTDLRSVSGDLTVSGPSGQFAAQTVSGDLHVEAGTLGALQLKTVSGALFVDAAPAADAKWQAETLSGDAVLKLPPTVSAKVTLHTFSGELASELPPRIPNDAHDYELQLGAGGATIDVSTFSGDVRLVKK